MLVNREALVGEVAIAGHLATVTTFKIYGNRRKSATKASALDMGGAEFMLPGEVVDKVP